jgi:hypothetical protein
VIAETQDRQAAAVVIDLTEREVLRVTSVRDISRLCECTWMPVYVRRRVSGWVLSLVSRACRFHGRQP